MTKTFFVKVLEGEDVIEKVQTISVSDAKRLLDRYEDIPIPIPAQEYEESAVKVKKPGLFKNILIKIKKIVGGNLIKNENKGDKETFISMNKEALLQAFIKEHNDTYLEFVQAEYESLLRLKHYK